MEPKYNVQAVPTSSAARVGGDGVRSLMKAVFYCAADGICEFKNATTDTGTVLLTISGLAKTTVVVDFHNEGGLDFSTGIFVKPTGTGNICYVWFE